MPRPLSLRKRLLSWLLAPLLLLCLVWAWGVYAVTLHFINIAYDRALEDSAQTLAGQVQIDADGAVTLPEAARAMIEFDQVDSIYYSVSARGRGHLAGNARIDGAADDAQCIARTCFYDTRLAGRPVRVAAYTPPASGMAPALTVRVGETIGKRETLAREVLQFILLPQALFVIGIGVLAWYGIGRAMAPLRRIRDAIASRTYDDLSPIRIADMPAELQEQAAVINDLMGRLDGAIGIRKRFIADATHQLRTPITVLRTQAELAMRIQDPAELQAALAQFDAATARLVRLANQLLSLSLAEARADASQHVDDCDFAALAEDVIAELVPLAIDKGIEITVQGAGTPVMARGNAHFLGEMMANLIDNAIRYTPRGGAIDIAIAATDAHLSFTVTDTGAGIPDAERHKVLQPFYRGPGAPGGGSGLGLTIAAEIAAMHGGRIRIADASRGGATVVAFLSRSSR